MVVFGLDGKTMTGLDLQAQMIINNLNTHTQTYAHTHTHARTQTTTLSHSMEDSMDGLCSTATRPSCTGRNKQSLLAHEIHTALPSLWHAWFASWLSAKTCVMRVVRGRSRIPHPARTRLMHAPGGDESKWPAAKSGAWDIPLRLTLSE